MRKYLWALAACCAVWYGGCETTEYCDDACTIWSEMECWGYDFCMDDCMEEKDWGKPYLKCPELADDCWELEECG